MPRSGHALLLAALFVLHATLATAQAPREEQSGATGTPPTAGQSAAELKARADRMALHAELRQNDEGVQREVAALEARIRLTDDATTRMLIQRHIEAAKFAGSRAGFEIQLRHARAMNRAADVRELQGVLAALDKQPVAALPALPPLEKRSVPAPAPASAKKASGK